MRLVNAGYEYEYDGIYDGIYISIYDGIYDDIYNDGDLCTIYGIKCCCTVLKHKCIVVVVAWQQIHSTKKPFQIHKNEVEQS